jgi:hypothetical protein
MIQNGIDMPIAVIGLWLSALRYRFNDNPGEPLPWVWSPDLKPDDDENGTPRDEPDGEPRKLMIEAAFNVEKEKRNYRPAIYVDRGPVVPMKHHVDNFAGQYTPETFKAYHSMADMPMSFLVESESSGECCLIADTAWFFVLSTRDIFRRSFGMHEISNPVLGPTEPQVVQDKPIWQTTVNFNVQFDLRWTTRPIAPFLREILARISRASNPQVAYHEMVLRDSES